MSISDHSENEVKLTEVENKRKKKYTSLRKLCSPKRVRILGKDIQFRFLERQAKRRKEICKAYLSPCFVIRNNEIVYSNYNQKFLEDLKKNYTYKPHNKNETSPKQKKIESIRNRPRARSLYHLKNKRAECERCNEHEKRFTISRESKSLRSSKNISESSQTPKQKKRNNPSYSLEIIKHKLKGANHKKPFQSINTTRASLDHREVLNQLNNASLPSLKDGSNKDNNKSLRINNLLNGNKTQKLNDTKMHSSLSKESIGKPAFKGSVPEILAKIDKIRAKRLNIK